MANKIQVKRGVVANLPTLSVGEPAFTTDTNQFYVGNGTTNIELAKATDLSDLEKKDLRVNTNYTDIFSTTLTSTHACWNKWVYATGTSLTNAPDIGAEWFEVFTGGSSSSSRAFQIAIGCYASQRKTCIRYLHDATWSDWSKFAVTSYHVMSQSEILNGFMLDTTQENVFIKVGNLNRFKLVISSTTDITTYTDVASLTDDVVPISSYVSIRQLDNNGNIVDIIAVNGTKRVQIKGMKANVKLCLELQWISN